MNRQPRLLIKQLCQVGKGVNMAEPVNPWEIGVAGAGDIIGGLINLYGINQANKQAATNRRSQERMFEENRTDQNAQYAQNFGEGQRQFNVNSAFNTQQLGQQNQQFGKTLGLNETIAGQNYNLGLKSAATADKQVNAQIAASNADRAQALKQKKLEDNLAMFNHITTFLNTPGARAQFASLWAGGK
jgi:hypothetical protein